MYVFGLGDAQENEIDYPGEAQDCEMCGWENWVDDFGTCECEECGHTIHSAA